MDRPLIALGLVLLSVPLLFSLTRGLLAAVLIAPCLARLPTMCCCAIGSSDGGARARCLREPLAVQGNGPVASVAKPVVDTQQELR
jgi:hypothetical protein